MADDEERLYCDDDTDWERWLEEHHTATRGVWLAIAKKGSKRTSPSYAEAVATALCFGWIDGQKKGLDADHFIQRFTRRRPRSIWSQRNRETIGRLTREGRMRPAGMREVERAKADGRWDRAYAPASTAEVPDDLRAALAASPEASALFAHLDATNRYAILFRIGNVARAETRARKIAQYVAMLERGETLYPRKASR